MGRRVKQGGSLVAHREQRESPRLHEELLVLHRERTEQAHTNGIQDTREDASETGVLEHPVVFLSDGILSGANALALEERTWDEVRDLSFHFFLVSPLLGLPFSPVVHPILEGVFNLSNAGNRGGKAAQGDNGEPARC